MTKINKTKQEWKNELEPEIYQIAFEAKTEKPFSNALNENKETGIYSCKVCNQELFDSKSKYDSGSGWPSFFKPINEDLVTKKTDYKLGIPRTEICCSNCGAHLGHVFNDGPNPTGLRYCMNGTVLDFKKK